MFYLCYTAVVATTMYLSLAVDIVKIPVAKLGFSTSVVSIVLALVIVSRPWQNRSSLAARSRFLAFKTKNK